MLTAIIIDIKTWKFIKYKSWTKILYRTEHEIVIIVLIMYTNVLDNNIKFANLFIKYEYVRTYYFLELFMPFLTLMIRRYVVIILLLSIQF